MPTKQPLLGSLAVQAPSLTPQVVHVSPSTCGDLSLFKDLLKEYRRLDDTIVMRLNRTDAQFRDRDRLGATAGKGSIEDKACVHLWHQLVENWKRRIEIVEYCVAVTDQSVDEKQKHVDNLQEDPAGQRRKQAEMFADEVKRNQIHNEIAVEKIVRQRSLDGFRTRCKYFEPPSSDVESRKWWDTVRSRS